MAVHSGDRGAAPPPVSCLHHTTHNYTEDFPQLHKYSSAKKLFLMLFWMCCPLLHAPLGAQIPFLLQFLTQFSAPQGLHKHAYVSQAAKAVSLEVLVCEKQQQQHNVLRR